MAWLPPPWVLFSLFSNLAIIATEYINRTTVGGFGPAIVKTWPLIFAAQFCLFKSFNGAPHWMTAWVVFALGNAIMRVGAVQVFAIGEISSWPYVLSGIGVMIGGAFVLKLGLS